MKNRSGFTTLELLIVVVIIFIIFILPMSFWTDRNLEFWLTYFKGAEVQVPFWLSLIATIIGNVVVLALNILSELARLVL